MLICLLGSLPRCSSWLMIWDEISAVMAIYHFALCINRKHFRGYLFMKRGKTGRNFLKNELFTVFGKISCFDFLSHFLFQTFLNRLCMPNIIHIHLGSAESFFVISRKILKGYQLFLIQQGGQWLFSCILQSWYFFRTKLLFFWKGFGTNKVVKYQTFSIWYILQLFVW